MESLYNLNYDQMCEYALDHGWKSYRGHQIFQWLYRNRVFDIDEMTNVSKETREILKKDFIVNPLELIKKQVSHDGTTKFLFKTSDGALLESVMMVFDYGRSVCVSSQVGCNMGCAFCASGLTKKKRDLTSGEMVAQVMYVQKELDKDNLRLSHIVVMGTGEPLDNYDNVKRAIDVLTADWGFGWSPKRITLSSIGVLPTLKRYLDETRCHLAISMHDAFPDERGELMPVQRSYDIKEVIGLIRQYDFTGQRRVSFEYTMFDGFNDDKRHCDAIIRLLSGLECRVNLIRFHKIPDFPYQSSSDGVMTVFRDRLNKAGITATVRASRGEDIFAACGMLAGRHKS